ncbi:MAG: LemA family protein [Rickettsiales bacterium]
MNFGLALGIVGAVVVILIVLYNRIVALKQSRANAFADVDVQLKQRYDLIPNLVEAVKGYMSHESGVFQKVTDARAAAMSASTINGKIQAEAVLDRALMDLRAVAENYPDLKASSNVSQLQSELADVENKIAAARRFFNNATNEYNTAIQQFPAILIARMFGFQQETFFDLGAERITFDKAPEVKF